jgi:hypothetical protein
VVNLAELSPGLDAERMKTLVAESFAEAYGAPAQIETVDLAADASLPPEVERLATRNASWDWLYGKTPAFVMTIRERFAWGGIEIGYITKHGRVESATSVRLSHGGSARPAAEALDGTPFTGDALSQRLLGLLAEPAAVPEEEQAPMREVAGWLRDHPL